MNFARHHFITTALLGETITATMPSMARAQLLTALLRSLFLLPLVLTSATTLAQKKDITVWPKGVPPGGITQKADFGDHLLEISHREKDGRAELHQIKADVMVIQSGTATLVSGGNVIDPVSIAPNEIQGSGIRGGIKQTVGPGDVIEIPVGVPHQFFLAPGQQITYLVIKIVEH
jgi:mannose-6-phosphate isomerase-like protein (cupin superfamily)